MRVELTVDIRAAANASLVDDLDAIEAQVSALLMADRTLGIDAVSIDWSSSETDLDANHERPAGRQRVTYSVVIQVDSTDHEIIV